MDARSTSDLPDAIFENGHFGAVPHSYTAPLYSWAHELRRRARNLAKQNDPQVCWREGFECARYSNSRLCPVLSTLEPSTWYHHFERQLQNAYNDDAKSFQTRRLRAPAEARVSGRRLHSRSAYSPKDLDNAVALARSGVPLPGERNHYRRPSLERQEAFYDSSTSKVSVRRCTASEDAQVAELYHRGILYNSSEDVKDTLDLNSISHSEPTYIIRPAKRARKSAKHLGDSGDMYSLEWPLHLDLSFSDIGNDEAIARFSSPTQQTFPEGMMLHASSHDSANSANPPLRVIYELAGSQGSVDIDASQPPDLMPDCDEYDVVNESEFHDTPESTQNSAADASLAAWVVVGDDL